MSLRLPPVGSPVRELFDMEQLAEAGMPGGRFKLPTLNEARRSGVKMIAESNGAIKAAHFLCHMADGAIFLVRIGAKGNAGGAWNFGNPDVKVEA